MTSRNALIYTGLVLAAALTVAPFGLGLLTSFTSAQQFATNTPLSLPRPPTLDNYSALGRRGFRSGTGGHRADDGDHHRRAS